MAKDTDACRYCGEVASGSGCPASPTGIHVKVGDEDTCCFCGSTSYGSGCSYSDKEALPGAVNGYHIHGHSIHKPLKCIYCGSTSKLGNCCYSPTGRHIF